MSWRDRASTDSFLEGLCLFRSLVYVLFVISFVFLLLSLVSYVIVEPGTETHAIVIVNLYTLAVFVLVSGTVSYLCRGDPSAR